MPGCTSRQGRLEGVEVGAIVLAHSPLTSAAAWGSLPRELGTDPVVVMPDVHDDNRPPYAVRYVASAAEQVRSQLAGPDGTDLSGHRLALVGHSGAGPLLPQLGSALHARGARIGGYVFCDAGLPRAGATRLELLEAENPEWARGFRQHLEAGGLFPEWTFDDLATAVPNPDTRRDLLAGLRPRGMGFFTEAIEVPADWPDTPCGYLLTSPTYQYHARIATSRGWPTAEFGSGHFEALNDPAGLAAALRNLLATL